MMSQFRRAMIAQYHTHQLQWGALVLLLIAASSTAHAQAVVTAASIPTTPSSVGGVVAPAQPTPLGLGQAYEAALVRDATLRAARAQSQGVAERLVQAQAQLHPNVSLTVSRFHNDLASTQSNALGQPITKHDNYYSYGQTLQLRQPLYRPVLSLGIDQARAQIGDAEFVLEREVQNLGVRVVEAYLQVLLAQEKEALLKVQYQFVGQQLTAARKRFEGGQGIRTDIDEAQARLDMVQAQQLEASQSRQTALLQLQMLVQQPVDGVASLVSGSLHPAAFDAHTVQFWMDKADARSPELMAMRARVEAARYEVQRAQSAHKPTLDAIVQISRSGSENVTSPQSGYINRQIGLQLNLPLYAGGAVQSSVRQALAEQARQEETLESVRRDLHVRVQKEWRGVTEGVLRIAALERAVVTAQRVVVSVRRSFEGGIRTVLDVLNAEQQAQQTQRDLTEARLAYVASRLRLLALVGELDGESFKTADSWFSSVLTTQ